jgi:hypothetical protein
MIEDLIASTRYRSVRGAHMVGYLSISVGVVFCATAIFFYFEGIWPLAAFVACCAIPIILCGTGFLRMKNKTSI